MRKKGQAAMEFLMTYGWAILAAIVVIGILGYYYFSKDILTPRSGVVNPPFYLNAWSVKTNGVTLEIKNNGGETYNVTSIVVSGCATNDTAFQLNSGSMDSRTFDCTLTEGNTFKGDITINYRKSGSSIDLISKGSITDTISA